MAENGVEEHAQSWSYCRRLMAGCAFSKILELKMCVKERTLELLGYLDNY
jgi:hypothetical protein